MTHGAKVSRSKLKGLKDCWHAAAELSLALLYKKTVSLPQSVFRGG